MSGSLRENVGKKDAKAQRAQGLVPCVIYGGEKQYQFVVPENQFKNIIYTPEVKYAELTIGDKNFTAIIKDSQYHPITDRLLHVDFLEVVEGKPITIELPMLIAGTSPGVLRGGKLVKKARKIRVKGLLANIPENVTVNISNMEINDNFRVSDLNIENLTIMENPNKILVSVLVTRNVEEVAPEAE